MHGRVGAFYAPRAGEGNPMLPVKASTSMDMMRGHSNP
jgi:hypothetical protein